jgi:hypothetical protein
MCKVTTNKAEKQEKLLFSLPERISDKKISVDFSSPDISSNGGLVLLGTLKDTLPFQIGSVISDCRRQEFTRHSYTEMVCQRVSQILCGYEDANDCDRLRDDSAIKMAVGRKPSDNALCSQPTMTRLENNVSSRDLYKIGLLFVRNYMDSFRKPPRKVILDADDTNANTYGAQQLTLFNNYYNERCYMPLLIFDGMSGKMILPMLRPGRRNKSLNIARILIRLVGILHERWPGTIIELRGDSHFCSHEFMDWAHNKWYVRYITGLSGNSALLKMVDKQRRRAENDYMKAEQKRKERNADLIKGGCRHLDDSRIVIRRYYKLEYKAKPWQYCQRVIAKIEISNEGTNIRFVVSKNRNSSPEKTYRTYCQRGEMELWIKDLKYFKADRMSCGSYRANYFRLFLYAAAYVVAYDMKHHQFKDTQVENFTMESLIKRIMLSAVHIREVKTYIRISFSPHHRHRDEIIQVLQKLAA